MKVLLTGAAGEVGYQTSLLLAKSNHEVILFDLKTKRSLKRLRPFQNKVKVVFGDINDTTLLKELLLDVDVVIHLAALIPPKADQYPTLAKKVNYQGTKNLVDLLEKYNPRAFLIYSSSVSVYGDRVNDYWIKVGDKLAPSLGDYYAETKIMAEDCLRASQLSYTIFRFSAIMGEPKLDPLLFHMPLETKLEITSTVDTAIALMKAINKEKELTKKIFNLGGGENFRTNYYDFLSEMYQIYGLSKKMIRPELFAEKNFHCGYYADSDQLETILKFQKDNLESYYKKVRTNYPLYKKLLSKAFSPLIGVFLKYKSEPYQARRTNNLELIARYFID